MKPESLALLALSFVPGLGPVLTRRLVAALGSPQAVLTAPEHLLRQVEGIGPQRAAAISRGIPAARARAEEELAAAGSLGVRILCMGDPDYPALLEPLDDAPTVVYVKGTVDPARDAFPIAIVGSRDCSAYGLEQAERFGGILAQAGLTVVSGGARGIDSAAHRGAVRVGGRTLAVLGCGLGNIYPPENGQLFDRIVESGGALVSELPLRTPPSAENFPARNRIISGLSLGVLVIEAAAKSGALITSRVATEDHGREVFALPGRVDSPHSRGTLDLLKAGGAQLVTEPADIIHALEAAAHHVHRGTHADRYTPAQAPTIALPPGVRADPLAEAVLEALAEPLTADQLLERVNSAAGALRSQLTLLEIQGRIVREGSRFKLAGSR